MPGDLQSVAVGVKDRGGFTLAVAAGGGKMNADAAGGTRRGDAAGPVGLG